LSDDPPATNDIYRCSCRNYLEGIMNERDANPTQGFRATEPQLAEDWTAEETYWRDNWQSRPYTSADLGYDYYLPAYRYGYESARSYRGRMWNDVENDVRAGWERVEDRGQRTWENVKEAVRDAWNRLANR
jgi:hypothetical protein